MEEKTAERIANALEKIADILKKSTDGEEGCLVIKTIKVREDEIIR